MKKLPVSIHMCWKGNSIPGIFICWYCLSKTILSLGSLLRWLHVDIVLQRYPTNRHCEPCTTMTPGQMMTWALKRETFYIYWMTGIHIDSSSLSCKIYSDIHSSTQHFLLFFCKFGFDLSTISKKIDCSFD